MENTIEIVEKKQHLVCEINKMVIYAQAKVVECKNIDNNELYYLFFYKNQFLTGRKATRVKLGGFIETAWKQGILLDASNPLLQILFSTDQTFTLISFKKLLEKLEQQSTPQEIALIFSFFSDYLTKDSLEKVIERQYFHYRRSGQLLYAFQILQIAKHFTSSKWATHTANQMEYQKYEKRYIQSQESLLTLDPIYVELDCYRDHLPDSSFQLLSSYYIKEKRMIDLLALSINHFSKEPTISKYHTLTHYLHKHCNETTYLETLMLLNKQHETFLPLKQEIIVLLLDRKDYHNVINLLVDQSIPLESHQKTKLKAWLTSQDVLPQVMKVEKANMVLLTLFKSEPQELEHILSECVTELLKEHNIKYVNNWLSPLNQEQISLPILNKVEKMAMIQDDPDKQFLLGEYYYDLHLYEQAIECFSWEMELNSTDPQPVRWLSRLYNELGMTNESKDYQQVFLSMQKHA